MKLSHEQIGEKCRLELLHLLELPRIDMVNELSRLIVEALFYRQYIFQRDMKVLGKALDQDNVWDMIESSKQSKDAMQARDSEEQDG